MQTTFQETPMYYSPRFTSDSIIDNASPNPFEEQETFHANPFFLQPTPMMSGTPVMAPMPGMGGTPLMAPTMMPASSDPILTASNIRSSDPRMAPFNCSIEQMQRMTPIFSSDLHFNMTPNVGYNPNLTPVFSPFIEGMIPASPMFVGNPMSPQMLFQPMDANMNYQHYDCATVSSKISDPVEERSMNQVNDDSDQDLPTINLKLSKLQSSTLFEVMSETPAPTRALHPKKPILQKIKSGGYVSASLDRAKSMKLQKEIATAKAKKDFEFFESMYYQFLPEILRLARDQYANFVCQRLIENLRLDLVDSLADKIKHDALAMATNQYSCRVLQSILSYCSPKYQNVLVNALLPSAGELLRHNYGCYVLQRIIQTTRSHRLKGFVREHIIPNYMDLCLHQYGCRVVQDIFRYFQNEDKLELTNCVLSHIVDISKNNYGNYVVQKMIHYGKDKTLERVLKAVEPNVIEICCNKAGSNILEKCLALSTDKQKEFLMGPIIYDGENLKKIVQDRFGNYVLQKLLDSLSNGGREKVVDIFNQYFATCDLSKMNTYENYVFNKISKS